MNELTLYDLMGEDHYLNASVNPETKYIKIEVTNDNDALVYSEESHYCAWESLVDFAKQVIAADARIQEHLKILEE